MPTPTSCKNCGVGRLCQCGICHTCGSRWTFCGSEGHNHLLPKGKTQKSKGLYALQAIHSQAISIRQVLSLDATEGDVKVSFPTFARPCPLTPRHGFVDSRVVESWDELKVVLDETKEADPEGEVMLVDYIPADLNAVWTPHLLTVGKGNDGATLGKDVTTFPLAGVVDSKLTNQLEAAGITPTDDPYVEAVYSSRPWLTQLRAGPKMGGSGVDYLPRPITVTTIIKVDPKMDLMEWERTLQAVNSKQNEIGEDGTVVWHPGGSPADHFSVHSRTFGIPVCITFEPAVGMTLDEMTTTPKLDPEGVLRGIAVGQSISLRHCDDAQQSDAENAINLVLHTLHHSAAIGGRDSWWMGVGVALMLRYGTVALRGEVRHLKAHYGSRDEVYAKSVNHTLQRHRVSTPPLINVLRYGKFSGSVGGIKWARCGRAVALLFDAVGRLANDPTDETCNELMRAFNFAVNQAHNGGWWLNKFISAAAFTQVQEGNLNWTIKLPPLLWKLGEEREKVEDEIVSRLVKQWGKWQPLNLSPVRVTEASFISVPGLNGLHISLKDKLLRTKHKSLTIAVDDFVKVLPNIIKGTMYVETTPDGLQVVVQPPHSAPIVVWKEPGIPETDK